MRSRYVYLIFNCTTLLSVHTVKYEAIEWFKESEWEEGEGPCTECTTEGCEVHEPMVAVPWSEI